MLREEAAYNVYRINESGSNRGEQFKSSLLVPYNPHTLTIPDIATLYHLSNNYCDSDGSQPGNPCGRTRFLYYSLERRSWSLDCKAEICIGPVCDSCMCHVSYDSSEPDKSSCSGITIVKYRPCTSQGSTGARMHLACCMGLGVRCYDRMLRESELGRTCTCTNDDKSFVRRAFCRVFVLEAEDQPVGPSVRGNEDNFDNMLATQAYMAKYTFIGSHACGDIIIVDIPRHMHPDGTYNSQSASVLQLTQRPKTH